MSDPIVGIVMGSQSDYPTMSAAEDVMKEFGVAFRSEVVSAHRTPHRMVEYAESAIASGFKVLIAGAGGAAHLPGMIASLTTLPVIGVPVSSKSLSGIDSLYSIVQMPAGIPVATVAIGNARNAGLLAIQILALSDSELRTKIEEFRASQTRLVLESAKLNGHS